MGEIVDQIVLLTRAGHQYTSAKGASEAAGEPFVRRSLTNTLAFWSIRRFHSSCLEGLWMGNSVGASLRGVTALLMVPTWSPKGLQSRFFCRLAGVVAMRISGGRAFRLRDPEATNGGGDTLDAGEDSPLLCVMSVV
jgi:hypothetical protein